MNKNTALRIIFGIALTIFILLFSYTLVLAFYPLTEAQENVLTFLEGNGELAGNYTAAEVSHLQDVAGVMQGATLALYLSAIAAAGILWHFRTQRETIRKLLKYSGITALAVIALTGIAAALSFDALFANFHYLFFPQGNWQFAADSLLIRTFTQEFFDRISIFIFGTAALFGTLMLLISAIMKNNSKSP